MLLSKALAIFVSITATGCCSKPIANVDNCVLTENSLASKPIDTPLIISEPMSQVESQCTEDVVDISPLNPQIHETISQTTARNGEGTGATPISMRRQTRARAGSQLKSKLASRDADTGTIAGIVVGATLLGILSMLCLTLVLCDGCGRR